MSHRIREWEVNTLARSTHWTLEAQENQVSVIFMIVVKLHVNVPDKPHIIVATDTETTYLYASGTKQKNTSETIHIIDR